METCAPLRPPLAIEWIYLYLNKDFRVAKPKSEEFFVNAVIFGMVGPEFGVRRILNGSLTLCDHVLEGINARHNFLLESAAIEDAIMSDARLNIIHAHFFGNIRAEIVCGLGLANA